MTLFDPLQDKGPPTPGLKASSSWLFQALDTCAGTNHFYEMVLLYPRKQYLRGGKKSPCLSVCLSVHISCKRISRLTL